MAEHLVIAARIVQHGGAALEREPSVFLIGGHRAELAKPAQRRVPNDEVVRELVERPLHAEVGAEGQREHERVRWNIATAVIADQQNRALGGDPVEPADVGAEV